MRSAFARFLLLVVVVTAIAGMMALPAQAQVNLNCITSAFPSSMTLGTPYSMGCPASGGSAPYTFAISSGSIPPGLTSAQVTGTEFIIGGYPIVAGTYSFTITITDFHGATASQSFTITVSDSSGSSITLSSISPSSGPANIQFVMTLVGTGFTSTCQVYFGGAVFDPTFISSTQLQFTIPAAFVTGSSIAVYVRDYSSGVSSGLLNFTVSGGGSALTLSSLSPSSIATNSAGFTLYINGSGFSTAGQLVSFGPYTLTSSFISSNQIFVYIPASYLTASQTVNVSVAGSNALPFVIGTGGTGSLTVNCNNPSALIVGSFFSQFCTVGGGNGNYTWSFTNLPTGLLPSTTSGSSITISGTPLVVQSYTIQVNDTAGHSGSYTYTTGPTGAYNISSLSPISGPLGVATTISVFGTGFTSASQVYFNGSALATTYLSTNQLSATIPSAYMSTTGAYNVFIITSGLGSTNSVPFTVGSTGGGGVAISSLSPTSVPVGSAGFPLVIFGSGFTPGVPVNFGTIIVSSTYISAAEVTALIPSQYLTTAQTVNVSVGASNSIPFVIGSGGTLSFSCSPPNGPPAIGIYFSQTCSVTGGSGSYTWTVSSLPKGLQQSGTTGSLMQLSGIPGSTQSYTVQVSDTAGHSASATYTAGVFVSYNIVASSPSSASLNSPVSLSIFGNGFTPASLVYFNGNVLATQYVSSNQLNASIPAGTASAGMYGIFVLTSDLGRTDSLAFIVDGNGSAVLSSISPGSIPAGSSGFTLMLIGSGFSFGVPVNFGAYSFSSNYLNSNEVTAFIPSQFLSTAQTVNVSIGPSNSLPFVIGAGSGNLQVTCRPTTGPTIVGVSYAQTCSVNGGTAPFTWTVTGLPQGVYQAYTTSDTVNITGTPTVVQSYSYTVTVNDSSAAHITGSVTISGAIGTSSYGITSLSPSSVAAGAGSVALSIQGNGFNTSSVVLFNSAQLSTQYVSTTQLNAVIPSLYLTGIQTDNISVYTPGLGSTNALPFTVSASSTLTLVCVPGVGPSTMGVPYSTTCTANGGSGSYNWPTPTGVPNYLTYNTTTGSSIVISGTPVTVATYNFSVKVNDTSLPVQSASLQFAGQTTGATVGGNIVLTSVSPASAPLNSGPVTLFVNGSGFSSNSYVVFDGIPIVTTFISPNQLAATIPAGQLTFAHSALVLVNTAVIGSSNGLTFTVGNGGTLQMSISCSPGVGPSLPNSYYTGNCIVNGGTGPYTWSISPGSLPSGLALFPNGPLASVTGYTSLSGPYSYTVQVIDSSSPANTATLVFAGETGL